MYIDVVFDEITHCMNIM